MVEYRYLRYIILCVKYLTVIYGLEFAALMVVDNRFVICCSPSAFFLACRALIIYVAESIDYIEPFDAVHNEVLPFPFLYAAQDSHLLLQTDAVSIEMIAQMQPTNDELFDTSAARLYACGMENYQRLIAFVSDDCVVDEAVLRTYEDVDANTDRDEIFGTNHHVFEFTQQPSTLIMGNAPLTDEALVCNDFDFEADTCVRKAKIDHLQLLWYQLPRVYFPDMNHALLNYVEEAHQVHLLTKYRYTLTEIESLSITDYIDDVHDFAQMLRDEAVLFKGVVQHIPLYFEDVVVAGADNDKFADNRVMLYYTILWW